MKVCMITGLDKLMRIVEFKNAGGMGTQVPVLVEKLREAGIDACIDKPEDCDIIHLHTPMPNYLFLIKKARESGAKIVIHARHLPELIIGGLKFGKLLHPVFHKYSVYLYNLADAVICATPYVKSWMEKNEIKSSLYVIPNGINFSMFKQSEEMRAKFRKKYGLEKKFVVLSVGLMIPRKGIHEFVEVAKRMKDKTFLWIGSSEKGMEKVSIEFPENVINIPYLPFNEMPLAYNGADIFFFPTYAESYGNVLMEASACKKAVVLRDIEVYKNWFIHGENCLKGNSVDEFVEAIKLLASNEELRKKMGMKACKTAREHDISKTIKDLIKVYEEILKQ